MMNIKKLTVTLAMAAVFTCAATAPTAKVSAAAKKCSQAQASCDFTKGKLCYKVTGKNTCAVTGVSQCGKDAVSCKIPANVKCNGKTYKVTTVKAKAFKNCKNLKSVQLCKNAVVTGNKGCNSNIQFVSGCNR